MDTHQSPETRVSAGFAAGWHQMNRTLLIREHFPAAWEVHCIAIHAAARGRGIGRSLHSYVESWLAHKGVRFLQVKTLSASSPSKEYAQTRAFYAAIGYLPMEEFPLLWEPRLPVLQLVKALESTQIAEASN